MSANSLYPGFVKLKYTANGHIHFQVLPVEADTHAPGVEPTFTRPGAISVNMNTAINEYIALIDNFYPAGASFILAEYWNIATVDSDPVFEYALTSGAVGVNGAVSQPNGQMCISFRSSVGGILKLYFMESSFSTDLKDEYPFNTASILALSDYLTDPTTAWVKARDGGYPIAGIRMLTKVNDALRKKYVLGA